MLLTCTIKSSRIVTPNVGIQLSVTYSMYFFGHLVSVDPISGSRQKLPVESIFFYPGRKGSLGELNPSLAPSLFPQT